MEWVLPERTPLSKGAEIELNGVVIVNDNNPQDVDEGSTCLVYRGHVKSGPGMIPGTSVIIREFYPKSDTTVLDIERKKDENYLYSKLEVKGITKKKAEYLSKLYQFQKGIEVQKDLATSAAMEIAVKPWLEGQYGDGYYVISDTHAGVDIGKTHLGTLAEKLQMAVCVAESMGILHEAGYIMPDFKPENLLYIEKPNNVRIIDTDSLWKYGSDIKKEVYANVKYASPELINIKVKVKTGEQSEGQIDKDLQRIMQPITDIYSMGEFFLEVFFQWLPEIEENSLFKYEEPLEEIIDIMKENGTLLQRFRELYKDEHISVKKLEDVGRRLISIIERATYYNRNRRKTKGFNNAFSMMKELSDLYYILTSEVLVPRKEIAKANGVFAAYNMLQKAPLYKYLTYENGKKVLSVVFTGNHAMLDDMLSAVISIGQMLDTELKIHLVGNNMESFWNNYTSEARNSELKRAVVVMKDGRVIMNEVDSKLVDRSLATIELHTFETTEVIRTLSRKRLSKYYVLLNENVDNNERLMNIIFTEFVEEKPFVGYIKTQEEDDYEESIYEKDNIYSISALSFSSTYNEKMFKERIYRMGLMAHAYYMGYMKENSTVNLEELEKEFKKDIYNIASSERVALHGIYKMESIGIHRNKPGRILNYYRSICDEETLEKLAWLEHLSWTGYMLTSGARAVSIDEFERYAYKGDNDWKCKEDKKHLKHPLLVSSKPKRAVTNEMWENQFEELDIKTFDPLDRVSYCVFKWYISQREVIREKFNDFMDKWIAENEKENTIQVELRESGTNLLNNMGKKRISQNQDAVNDWNQIMKRVKIFDSQTYDVLNIIMKPAVDSYKDCDFKGLDRELVFSVVDMLM